MQGRGNGPVPPKINPARPTPNNLIFHLNQLRQLFVRGSKVLVYKYYQGQTCSLYCLKIILSMRLTFNLQIGYGIIITIPLKKNWTKRKATGKRKSCNIYIQSSR